MQIGKIEFQEKGQNCRWEECVKIFCDPFAIKCARTEKSAILESWQQLKLCGSTTVTDMISQYHVESHIIFSVRGPGVDGCYIRS